MLPSAAAVTASSPSKRAGRHDDLSAMLFRQGNEIGVRQQRTGAEHHDGLAGFQHGPADPLEERGGRAFDREIGEVRETPPAPPADRRCARHRAKPAPWPGRGRPHRRARAPACRRRAGAQRRGRSHRDRLWRRGSLENLPRSAVTGGLDFSPRSPDAEPVPGRTAPHNRQGVHVRRAAWRSKAAPEPRRPNSRSATKEELT